MYCTLSAAILDFRDFQQNIVGDGVGPLDLIATFALHLGGCIIRLVLVGSLYILELWSICNFFWLRVVLS